MAVVSVPWAKPWGTSGTAHRKDSRHGGSNATTRRQADRKVRRDGEEEGLYGDGGLYLKVVHGNNKNWIVRWSSHGKVHKLGIGATHTVSLSDARERAANVRRMILDNVDPREARRAAAVAAAKTISFNDARDLYIESHKAGWKNAKHIAEWGTTLETYASPVFGKLPVSAIDVGLVMRVLEPLWTSKNATAFRLRGRIEAILSWAKVHGYREGENPALWRGNLDHLLPARGKVHKIEHRAALPYDQLPAFLRELRERQTVAARALEFTILCAVRTGETLHAAWCEFDLANKVWTIPAARKKADREHRVPLSDRAIDIVTEMQAAKTGDLVFARAKRGHPRQRPNALEPSANRAAGSAEIVSGLQIEPILGRLPKRLAEQ
jgi:integrase